MDLGPFDKAFSAVCSITHRRLFDPSLPPSLSRHPPLSERTVDTWLCYRGVVGGWVGGRVVVADRENQRIQFFNFDGAFVKQWHIHRAVACAVDPTSNMLLVAEQVRDA